MGATLGNDVEVLSATSKDGRPAARPDRDRPGEGFTHKTGDIVRISSPALGTLVNRVRHAEDCEPWDFGVRDLMGNLMKRGVL